MFGTEQISSSTNGYFAFYCVCINDITLICNLHLYTAHIMVIVL